MLAYVFWHRPRDGEDAASYERLLTEFHHSLAHSPPAGTLASVSYRVPELPWFQAPAYEDWYLVEDFAALGVLNEAAVGRGHRSRHDQLALHSGAGAGGLYALLEGRPDAATLMRATLAVWVEQGAGDGVELRHAGLPEMLADGIEPGTTTLWRRQLVLGPAPEFCLLGREVPSGTLASRLPAGWRASTLAREALTGA